MKSYIQKQREAIVRQAAHSKLTVAEKIAKLDKGGFAATKERGRLNNQLATEQAHKVEVAAPKKVKKKS